MSRLKGAGGARAAWRQQQAAAAGAQQALRIPSTSCRPFLIQSQLAPLFAKQPLPGSSSRSGTPQLEAFLARAVPQLQRALQGDERHGLNRVIAHALLFSAWDEVRALEAPCARDEFAQTTRWQLPTGAALLLSQTLLLPPPCMAHIPHGSP